MEAVGVILVIGLILFFMSSAGGSGRSMGPTTPEFRGKSSPVDQAVARSAASIPWDAATVRGCLPVSVDGEPIRPRLASVDHHPGGTSLVWRFPAGFGQSDWDRVWPAIEGYLAGSGDVSSTGLSRSGVTIIVGSRDALGGTRGPSWLE